ncbi:MAG TPA: hypothetical protein ENH82_04135, partial [bacterium]|nr:hypothetical protein [bacterium]
MKRIILIVGLVFIGGCLFPTFQNLHSIIKTHNEYSLIGVIESYDAINLKKHIPDYAPVFIEFGVDSCLVAEFRKGMERYTVEIYSFLNPKGALGTYNIMDIPGSQTFKLGYLGRKSNKAVQFVKGHYIVTVNPVDEGTIEGAVKLASGFEKRIEGGKIRPDIFETLPQTNLVKNTELYFKGPRAFEYRFSLELSKALNVQYALEGTAAKYA